MLASPHTNSWGFVYTNQVNGATAPGQTVVPGASNVEGSTWTEIGPDASITTDIHYVTMMVMGGNTSAQSKQHLLDFGWDPAGGTTYVPWFSDLAVGGSNAGIGNGPTLNFHFPTKIPAGSAIAFRVQGSNATAGTVRVLASFYGKPSRPELWRPAAYTETLGYTANTLGTSFTPGNAGWGSWVSLGSPAKKHFWGQLGVQIDNATCGAEGTRCQLGIGDGTNMNIIVDQFFITNAAEAIGHITPPVPCFWEIPAGSTLYVRGNCSGAPTSGYNATAVLFGG